MPNRCVAWGCAANASRKPNYTAMVKFPTDPVQRERWIAAMPNTRKDLETRKGPLFLCRRHFTCKFVSAKGRGGKRPCGPPSKFEKVAGSQKMQTAAQPRDSTHSLAEARLSKKNLIKTPSDKIMSLEDFIHNVSKVIPECHVHCAEDGDVTLYFLDRKAQSITQSLVLKTTATSFGFLQLVCAEKKSCSVTLSALKLKQRSSHIHSWTEIKEVVKALATFELPPESFLKRALSELEQIQLEVESPCLHFLSTQLEIVLKNEYCYRFQRPTLIFAAELLSVSPAAYRLIKRLKMLVLPCEKSVRRLMSGSLAEVNLRPLFEALEPQQRICVVVFDEVKLRARLRLNAGHVIGNAVNRPDDEATSALVLEIVCCHGGPKQIIKILPVHKLNSTALLSTLLDALANVVKQGGAPLSLVSDNCPLNQAVYTKLGGAGQRVYVESLGIQVFLTYDYVHCFKNFRNNWISETRQTLKFKYNKVNYIASWKDVAALYAEDSKSLMRLTRLTHTSVYPTYLQRQSVPLVCRVFNEKTVSAFRAYGTKVGHHEGTPILIQLMTNWFKIHNVKDQYAGVHSRDPLRDPWTLESESLKMLNNISEVIGSLKWEGGHERKFKLTKMTADAIISTAQANVAAATFLLQERAYSYVLPACFSQDPIEKFFGQARQRNAGNFYIDILDVKTAASATNLHQLLKVSIMPVKTDHLPCESCSLPTKESDRGLVEDISIEDTEELLKSDDPTKNQVVYVAGYLTRIHRVHNKQGITETASNCPEEDVSCDFLDDLNRGGLAIPTFSTVFLVHSAIHIFKVISSSGKTCRGYLGRLLSEIDAPLASDKYVISSLAKTLLKGYVISSSDRASKAFCLRRQEKLQSTR